MIDVIICRRAGHVNEFLRFFQLSFRESLCSQQPLAYNGWDNDAEIPAEGAVMQSMEILAPVGGQQQLIAAVRAGADAVYLGAQGFNARRNAQNPRRWPMPMAGG